KIVMILFVFFFFFSSRRRHTRFSRDWSSDVCSSDLRLCAEHLEENNNFLISIPNDEPIDEVALNEIRHDATESLSYFLNLLLDLDNKHNLSDLKEYNKKMLNHA